MREVHNAKVRELCELRRYRTSELVMAKNESLQAWQRRSSSCSSISKKQRRRRRDGSTEAIVGEVYGVQRWRQRWRDGACEEVMEEVEGTEAMERGDGGRDRSSYGVVMEAEASQRVEATYL